MKKELMRGEAAGLFTSPERCVLNSGEKAITILGVTKRADDFKGYLEGTLSHAFPVVCDGGVALEAGTIANSYGSMQDQLFDLSHLMRVHSTPENPIPEDKVLGTIVGVEFPPTPEGGWKLAAPGTATPGIRMVAVLHKQVMEVWNFLKEYAGTGAPFDFALSMEMHWKYREAGYAIFPGSEPLPEWIVASTPADFLELDYGYVPWTNVMAFSEGLPTGYLAQGRPGEAALAGLYDMEAGRIHEPWQGRQVAVLGGGINGTVRYSGVALVKFGAEPTAAVSRLLASHSFPPELLAKLQEFRRHLMEFKV